jgi:NAD(P)-dependent dehydrogenase (short-subunit alcohol dehydrogenase family)
MLGMEPEEYFEVISESLPLKRFGEPSEIAGMCTYLASEDASFTTGAAMLVDAGTAIVDVVGASILGSLKKGGVL